MAELDRMTIADTEQLFEEGTVIVFKCNATKDFPITFISGNALNILGYGPDYFLSKKDGWTQRIHPEDRQNVIDRFNEVLEKGKSSINEYRFKRKDGVYIWLRDEIKMQLDEQGNPKSILGASFEITERKHTELEAHKQIENELRKRLEYQHALSRCSNLLIDSSGPGTIDRALAILLHTTNTDRVYIFTINQNKAGEKTISQINEVCRKGVNPEIDNPDLQNMPIDSLPWVFGKLSQNKIISTPIEKLPSPEKEFMMDQDIKSFLLLPIFIEDNWFGFLGFDATRQEKEWDEHEITLLKTASEIVGTYFKRKATEESLMQQKNFVQQILDSLPGITVLMNNEMKPLQWNKTMERLTGYSPMELANISAYELIDREEHGDMEAALSRILSNKREGQELNLIHKNGKRIPFFWRGNVLHLEGESVFVIVGLNITQQKEMETALIEEKRLADAIINSLPGIFYMLNESNKIIRINRAFSEEFGYSELDIIGRDLLDFYSDKEKATLKDKIHAVYEKGSADVELNPINKKGEKIPYYLKATRFIRNDDSYLVGTGHNISEQKQREAELEASVHEKQVLLQEIHHRVKNNLAVISGLLELQVYEFEDVELRRVVLDSQRRIQTMAMIHEKLYQSENLSRISMLLYMEDLVHQIAQSFGIEKRNIKIKTTIDDFELNINQAIPFALALNEIISNALEHAFIDKPNGELIIEVQEAEGKIQTFIQDNGIGMGQVEEQEKSKSLGMTLINALLTQIDADWNVDGTEGVTYSIAFTKKLPDEAG